MVLAPGHRLGAHEIVGPLGAGGMGEVYRARDLRLGREIALKLLAPGMRTSAQALARFEREARTLAGLNHPNIVTLHSVEDDGDTRYITMELVEGRSLREMIPQGGMPFAQILDLAIPLADALDAAHRRGVIHRDLKPANVMVGADGRVKVLDFGLAKLDEEEDVAVTAPVTMAGHLVGTIPYMAPEQHAGSTADARADLFAFGVLVHELATGRRPFAGNTPAEIASAILRDPPDSLAHRRPDLPQALAGLVARCLQKDPASRIQTAQEVKEELDRLRAQSDAGTIRGLELVPLAAEASIAVLPFETRGRYEEDELFAVGVTEDVIAQLCKSSTMKVISRRSVMALKGRDLTLPEIGARLGVGHVVEGSVRRVGDRVRILAELTDVASGQLLWAETYDRKLSDVFEIQADVALRIANALSAQLLPGEQGMIHKRHTSDMRAYDAFLRGRYYATRFTLDSLRESTRHFEDAIRIDPAFVPAHVGLAMALTDLVEHGAVRRESEGARAVASALRALSLDADLGESHCALGYARAVVEFDYAAAEENFRRALELSPGSADTYDLFGRMLAGLERYDEAITLLQRARELDPLLHGTDLATTMIRAGRYAEAQVLAEKALRMEPNPRRHATLGWSLLRQGRAEEGLRELEIAVETGRGDDMWLAQLGQARAVCGQRAEAEDILARLLDRERSAPASPYHLAYVHVGLGQFDAALDCLEEAVASGSGALSTIRGSFLLSPLRDQPRFHELLGRLHQI